MQNWYLRLEARLKEGSPIFTYEGMTEGCAGVFASCLVPKLDRREAEVEFREELSGLKVTLVELVESFPVDGGE